MPLNRLIDYFSLKSISFASLQLTLCASSASEIEHSCTWYLPLQILDLTSNFCSIAIDFDSKTIFIVHFWLFVLAMQSARLRALSVLFVEEMIDFNVLPLQFTELGLRDEDVNPATRSNDCGSAIVSSNVEHSAHEDEVNVKCDVHIVQSTRKEGATEIRLPGLVEGKLIAEKGSHPQYCQPSQDRTRRGKSTIDNTNSHQCGEPGSPRSNTIVILIFRL
mmetsp:Transcript_32232/g.51424  ORF Transcript_32232/g.51424 Transcript_32232/m.51424 type:complete len:220 (-) Transcript_32232:292-951(-)